MVENSHLHEQKNNDWQLKSQPHTHHEFADESDIILGAPLIGLEIHPVGKSHRTEKRNTKQDEITKENAT